MKKTSTRSDQIEAADRTNWLRDATVESRQPLKPTVDSNIEAVLGQDLRSMFSDILDEPVPQRFVDLLDDLVNEAEA